MTTIPKTPIDSNVSVCPHGFYLHEGCSVCGPKVPPALNFAAQWLLDNPEPVPAPPADICVHGVPVLGARCDECNTYWAEVFDNDEAAIQRRAMRAQYQAELDADREAHAAKLEAEYQAARKTFAAPTPPAPPSAVVPALPTMITKGNTDKYEATLDYVRRTLETDGLLSFDTFRGEPMLQRGVTQQPMSDEDYIDLRTAFEREKNFAPVGKEIMRDAVLAEAKRRRFDSGIAWLGGLQWDGVARVDTFMATHFGAEDSEYTRAVSRYMWSGLAGRMLKPGCQLDMVIALLAKQGTKKSTGLKALVPDPDWFTDGLSLHEDTDNFKRLIRGKVIAEIAELAGLGKADVGVIKRVITRTTEKWIEKYQTKETSYERRCMLFATTNEERFLPPDETGQRRWLPIEVVELNRALIAADRDQLWAEGAAIFSQSGIAYSDAERLAEGRHKRHEATDVWVDQISAWLITPPAAGGPLPCERPLSTGEILTGALRLSPDRQDMRADKRVGIVMRELGYERKNARVNGAVCKRWVRQVPPPPP